MRSDKNNKVLLVYTQLITNRIGYIFDFILKQELGLEYRFCQSKNEFEISDLNKFSYSAENDFSRSPFFKSNGLLQKIEIEPVDIDIFDYHGYKAFFRTNEKSFFGFDIFAASFYLISRYEEYLPFLPDKYGRYDATSSLAFREGFLELPLINIWIELFQIKLAELFPGLIFKKKQFQYISTIDIDNAFADLHKGFIRTTLSVSEQIIKLKFNRLLEKIKVLANIEKDKYDNYDFLESVHKKFNISPIYFILYSKYGKYDKNNPPKNKNFIRLIEKLANLNKTGIHPSYQSNKSLKILKEEKSALEKIVKKPIIYGRQHFLKLSLPNTYENLINIGIQKDFTMGYASYPGFRASVCSSFRFFNLETNKETKLEVVPLAVMDVCLIDYLKLNPENGIKKIKKIIGSVKKVNGLFVSLYHNETLFESNNQFNWRNVFEQMLEEANNGNSLPEAV